MSSDRPPPASVPFRLSQHADFLGSILIPDRVVAGFNARVLRLGSDECWPYRFRPRAYGGPSLDRDPEAHLEIDLRRYFLISWTEWGWKQAIPAHRLALLQDIGPLPLLGLYACHLCDTRSCMNPRHLYPGTPQQNADDRVLMDAVRAAQGTTEGVVLPRHPRSRIVCEALIAGTCAELEPA